MTRPLLVLERPDEACAPDRRVHESLLAQWDEAWGEFSIDRVAAYPLVFYTDVLLVRVDSSDSSTGKAAAHFLCRESALFQLTGSSLPIHDVNSKSRPWLRRDTVLDYLAFFCFFVRGERGPFAIVDRRDSVYIADFPDADALENVFRAPEIVGQDENGDWRVSALVYYGNTLFRADFLVHLMGWIEMKDDRALLSDLPDHVDLPL